MSIETKKLVLVTFTDECGRKFPDWVINGKCQTYNVTLGKTYECLWIGNRYLIKENDIGEMVTNLRVGDFREIGEVRDIKINQIIDEGI